MHSAILEQSNKAIEKIVYLGIIFLNIVDVPILSSPLPPQAMLLCLEEKA